MTTQSTGMNPPLLKIGESPISSHLPGMGTGHSHLTGTHGTHGMGMTEPLREKFDDLSLRSNISSKNNILFLGNATTLPS